jgi:hypothetical protein
MVLQLLEDNVQLLKSNDLHIAEQNYTNWETGISLFRSSYAYLGIGLDLYGDQMTTYREAK